MKSYATSNDTTHLESAMVVSLMLFRNCHELNMLYSDQAMSGQTSISTVRMKGSPSLIRSSLEDSSVYGSKEDR